MNSEFHVSIDGNDHACGSIEQPFRTISQAAKTAETGDTIIVHEGTYREWVKPSHSGYSDLSRITYKAAEGEKVIIKGSEIINTWELLEGSTWQATIPNTLFGDYNPYNTALNGDWFVYPEDLSVHAGDVYLNGKSFYEAKSINEVKNPIKRDDGFQMPLSDRVEYLLEPENTVYQWYAEVKEDTTTIYANFQGANPNEELVEINVRECCFYPEKTGMNYITVQGFEMAQAATRWIPPTADQVGLLGPNWSKGWIIEDNIIHDSKCSAISLGKEGSTGDNLCTRRQQKPGYQYQLEAVFSALAIGWSKDTIGSHIVRNNVLYDCGQNGVVGHLGCIFSQVYDNHIYNIGVKHEFFGWEIAAIKFHVPIDVIIRNNRIHDCTLGIWLDWQSQGTRVSNNLLYRNNRDCTIEVTHGPLILDNNIMASAYNFDNHAQGTAFINNLFCGTMKNVKIMDRSTPYHFAHSTQVAGYACVYGNDDRVYNNIYVGGKKPENETHIFGTAGYNEATTSYEEYHEKVVAKGMRDVDKFIEVEQPAYIDGNVYMDGADGFVKEEHAYTTQDFESNVKIIEDGSDVYLEITADQSMLDVHTKIHSTSTLGTVRLVDVIYDDVDGQPITIDTDYLGNPRSKQPQVGPLEGLTVGVNRIKVW